MQPDKKDLQSQFHRFLEHSENKPQESAYFPQFQYMEQSLKYSFKIINKKNKINVKEQFVSFWKELPRDEQINFYCKNVRLLTTAINKILPELPTTKEGQILIKKSMISNWEKKNTKISKGVFTVNGTKKVRVYELKNYALRKSKNKQYFGWVLEAIEKTTNGSLHCGVSNVKDYDQWYDITDKHINFVKVEQFEKIITENKKNGVAYPPTTSQTINTSNNNTQFNRNNIQNIQSVNEEEQSQPDKTITEIIINNQLVENQHKLQVTNMANSIVIEEKKQFNNHPNIFKKLMPEYNIFNFTEIPNHATLLHCDSQYRLCEISQISNDNNPKLKLITILPYSKSLVFKAVTEEVHLWNSEVDTFTIKTSITSENAAIMYEKHKPQGLLYRQRDFLFIRHCFCIQNKQEIEETKYNNNINKNRTFIIDKSVDSLSFPPFMSVARGEKEIVWCLVEGDKQKECLLVVEGWVKGGGYMNLSQNKQMTMKQFKNVLKLDGYLKQKCFTNKGIPIQMTYFKQDWDVDFSEDKTLTEPKPQKRKSTQDHIQEIEKEKQFQQFIAKSEEHQYGEERTHQQSSNDLDAGYVPPQIIANGQVKINSNYLKTKHSIEPIPKPVKPHFSPNIRGHHILKGQWQIDSGGGLNYIDEQKMKEQKKVLTYIIKRIGKNILSGKGILNVSLPVDIFCRESNIQRMAMSLGYCPVFLQKAAQLNDETQQLKNVIAANMGFGLIYITMQKPFNPILGETYQSWIDGCPIYSQQISHHPPVAAFLMKGRGYDVYGSLEAKMQLSLNSGTGCNQGVFTVKFKNGNKFYFTGASGQLSGLTYGSRKLNFVGRVYYWTDTGLFLEITYNPSVKNKRFFGTNPNYVGQEKLSDFFQGVLKRYKKQDLDSFLFPKKNDNKIVIPKSSPPFENYKELYRVSGRCFQNLNIDDEKIFDANQTRYYANVDDPNPLPSHSNYREDIVHRKLCNFVKSQQWKQLLQIKQRKDRKLREEYYKKNK